MYVVTVQNCVELFAEFYIYIYIYIYIFLTRQVSSEQILIYNDGLPRPILGQLCSALWDSQSRLDVIQPGFEPGTVVTSLALRCIALDRCVHVCVNYLTGLDC